MEFSDHSTAQSLKSLIADAALFRQCGRTWVYLPDKYVLYDP